MAYNVLLVDDHKILRDGIKTILERTADFRVVGEAESGADAVSACRKLHPDLVLMDIGLPGLNGIEATIEVLRHCPRTKVMMLSMYDDENSVVAAKLSEVPVNSGKIFKFGNKPGILVHTSSGEFKAFSAVCTHLECIVQYRDDTKQIWCACHNGQYNLSGKNIGGPPPRPLEEYKVNTRGDDVVVTRA